NSVVSRLDKGDDRFCRQWDGIEVLRDCTRQNLARDITPRAIHGCDSAVSVIIRLVEHRRIRPGGAADDLGDDVLARPVATLLERHPLLHNPREAFFAVADNEDVDEWRQNFRILGAGSAGDHQRILKRTVFAMEGYPAQLEHSENVRVTNLILQTKPQQVEVAE